MVTAGWRHKRALRINGARGKVLWREVRSISPAAFHVAPRSLGVHENSALIASSIGALPYSIAWQQHAPGGLLDQ